MNTSMLKSVLAVVCILAAFAVGLPLMLVSETNTVAGNDIGQIYTMSSDAIRSMPGIANMIENGLKPYFLGFGLVLFLCAVAFILVDGEDKLAIMQHGKDTDTPA